MSFNSPIDQTTVSTADFIVPTGTTVTGVSWNARTRSQTVTVDNALAQGDVVGVKAQSTSNADGGNGRGGEGTATTIA